MSLRLPSQPPPVERLPRPLAPALGQGPEKPQEPSQAVWEGLVRSGALPVAIEPGRQATDPKLAVLASDKERQSGQAMLLDEKVAHNLGVWKEGMAAHAKEGVFPLELGDGKKVPGFTVRTAITDAEGTTHTAESLVEALTELTFGKALLANESWGATRTAIGFIADGEWPAFERFAQERGLGLPKLSGSAFPVWVKDGSDSGGHVLFVVPAAAAKKTANVAWDMRDAAGIGELRQDLVHADHAVARAEAELASPGGRLEDNLRGVRDMLLRSDVREPRVAHLLDRIEGHLLACRDQKIGAFRERLAQDPTLLASLVGNDALGALTAEVKLSAACNFILDRHVLGAVADHAREGTPASRKALVRQLAMDQSELSAQREYAERKLRAQDAIASGPDWVAALQQAARAEVAHASLEGPPAHQWHNLSADKKEALESVVRRGADKQAFAGWMAEMIDKVAARMAASTDPVVQERLARRELDPAIVREVAYEEAQKVGFAGVHTIDASAGYLTPAQFYPPLAEGKLIDDPFFAVDTGVMGLHGRDIHVLQWVFLAAGEPRAVEVYRDIAKAYLEDEKAMIEKNGDPFYALFDSPALQKGLMSPTTFTRLTAPFLGNQ